MIREYKILVTNSGLRRGRIAYKTNVRNCNFRKIGRVSTRPPPHHHRHHHPPQPSRGVFNCPVKTRRGNRRNNVHVLSYRRVVVLLLFSRTMIERPSEIGFSRTDACPSVARAGGSYELALVFNVMCYFFFFFYVMIYSINVVRTLDFRLIDVHTARARAN